MVEMSGPLAALARVSVPSADRLSELLLALGSAVFLAMIWRNWPQIGVACWLVVVAFVPCWLEVVAVVTFPPATVAGIFLLLVLSPLWPSVWCLGDWLGLGLFLTCLAPIAVNGSTRTAAFVVITHWAVGYALGRLIPSRVALDWVYRAVAVTFTLVSVGGLLEFAFSKNPFVLITAHNSDFHAWSGIQDRGGLARVEGAFGHSIAFGASVALAIPIALASRFQLRTRIVMVALMLGAEIVTFSRIGIACAVLGVSFTAMFAGDAISARLRGVLVALLFAGAAAAMPFLASTFESAGSEASDSASYRGDLTTLLPDISVLGLSPARHVAPNGDLFFGQFRSIDSAMMLLGLTYGWLALIAAAVALAAAVYLVVARQATPPTIAIAAHIPALLSVALITQYETFVFFLAGLAVSSQAHSMERQRALTAGRDVQPQIQSNPEREKGSAVSSW